MMNKVRQRAFVLAGVLIVFGVGLQLAPGSTKNPKSEDWLEQNAPKTVGKFHMLPGSGDPEQTYKMDKLTYEVLQPYGIVARVFGSGADRYDVVVIAGGQGKNFHNPTVCFRAQGWIIESEESTKLPTKTRGDIPAVLARVKKDQIEQYALFFFKGPSGFNANLRNVKIDMMWSRLLGKENSDGIFYRIIPLRSDTPKESLIKFASDWLDEANTISNGYF